jgi:hypothetical protein
MKHLTINRIKKVCFLPLICLITMTCNKEEKCPEEVILGPYLTYNTINEFILLYDTIQSLKFINTDEEEIEFVKFENRVKVKEISFYDTQYCEENDLILQNRKVEIESSYFSYASNQNDTLYISFIPDVHFMNPDVFTFYRKFNFIIGESDFWESRALWDDDEINEVFKYYLTAPFEVGQYSFEDVYFWNSNYDRDIFFTDELGIIGFIDKNLVTWIRIL